MNKLWLVNKIQNCNKTKIRTFKKKKNNNKTYHFRLPKLECWQPDPANCRFVVAETCNIPRKLKQNIFSKMEICKMTFKILVKFMFAISSSLVKSYLIKS
jgi:hypothetical protein